MSSYVELHSHSAFSFLDGASLPDELVAAAVSRGHGALALTDHDNLCGAMEFAQAAKAAGLKAIHGAELTLDDGRHLTVLVENQSGWRNLCRILTVAHSGTRSGRLGAPPTKPHTSLSTLLENCAGLVCLTGCADHGVNDEETVRQLLEGFGRDHLRVELQRPFHRGDLERNEALARLAGRVGVSCVATGNVHSHDRSRVPLQDAFVSVSLGLALDATEPRRRGNGTHALTTPEAMEARFRQFPEAVAQTSELADRLDFDLTRSLGYRYPREGDASADRELAEVCQAAFAGRYGNSGRDLEREAQARLEEELKVIETLGLSGFFLLHRDLLELAREVAVEVRGPDTARSVLPPGRGRGSSVSSIVCYLTGLSHIDPVAGKLCLGRFLNDELTSVPDIDLDFPRDIRERLIPRIHSRYGEDHTALVAAFPTYRSRSAIRDLGAALGLPKSEIERVARASEGWTGRTVANDIETALGPSAADNPRWQWLARLANEAYGLPRHLAQHSGGMIVATEPLTDCCPIVPSAMQGRRIAQWDKDSCADAGFLKIDLLGLGMLSAVERCVDLVAKARGERLDLSRIPLDDHETFEAIRAAETTGVFQIESRAQMSSLLRTRPQNLDDLTIQVAIVRPGPIQGGAVNPYIARRRMRMADPQAPIDFIHPSLEPVLEETLGTIIFQDQVLEVATAFAGFTAGEAESLRRAMSKKRSSAAVEAHRIAFIEGARQLHGVDGELAERVFTMIRGFSGFGFPKSHSAAFGLLAYQSTWLRVHHPAEFLASLLDEQPMGFYPPDALVHEAQRRGVSVLPVDVNSSGVECTVEQGAVRLGLLRVKGVGKSCARAIVESRERDGTYPSTADLAARSGASKPALESLAWAGACDRIAGSRRDALWQLGVTAAVERHGDADQLAFAFEVTSPNLPKLGEWGRAMADYSSSGIAIEGNPVGIIRGRLGGDVVAASRLASLPHGVNVSVAGLVVARQRPSTAGGIVFLLLEDETGTINVVIKSKVYDRYRLIARTEPLMVVKGVLERPEAAGGGMSVLAHRLEAIDRSLAGAAMVRDLFDVERSSPAVQGEGAEVLPRTSLGRRGR
jgi:error-prone DNA polymerase